MSLREIAVVADPDRTLRVAIAINYIEEAEDAEDEAKTLVGCAVGEMSDGTPLLTSFHIRINGDGELVSGVIEELDEDLSPHDYFYDEKEGALKRLNHWCSWGEGESPTLRKAMLGKMRKVPDGYEFYSDDLNVEDLAVISDAMREWPYDTKWEKI